MNGIVNIIPIFWPYSHDVIKSLTQVIMKPDLRLIRGCFTVQLANTPELSRKAHRLRYQVYCAENDYLDGDGLEVDEFDCQSHHVILRENRKGEVVGTVRLVLWRQGAPEPSFPIQQVTSVLLKDYVPLSTTAELSRFAISKSQRDAAPGEAGLLLMLVEGSLRLSNELGITHWVSVMEPRLLQLLRTSAVYFSPIGKLIGSRDLRQPCFAKIETMLARARHECPEIWNLLTDHGTLWPASADLAGATLAAPNPPCAIYATDLKLPRVGSFESCSRLGDMDRDHSRVAQGTNARLLVPG